MNESKNVRKNVSMMLTGMVIGAALTGACIDCAKEAGFRQLELEVVGDNENAVRLYKRYGFMESGSPSL